MYYLFQRRVSNMEFNYKDTAKDIGWDFSKIHYNVEQDNPYYYYHKVIEYIKSDTKMLDIGCGSGEKSIRYFSNAKKIVMLYFNIYIYTHTHINTYTHTQRKREITSYFLKMHCILIPSFICSYQKFMFITKICKIFAFSYL